MKPCSRNTFLVTGTLLAMFLLYPAGQEASAATQGTNPDKICKYKKKCSSCSSGDCSSDSSAEEETKEIRISQNKECPSDPTEVGLTDEYEFAGEELPPSSRSSRTTNTPPVNVAGGFSSDYVNPKNLKIYGDGGEIVRDADTNIRQIKGDTGFMDVIFTSETKTLELRLYKPESIELKKVNGVYPIKSGEKALTIIRYVQEADGRVRTETIDNTAEFPSVKSERVTQEVGTEPYTLIQTKTYLKGEGSSAIEYKRVSKKITAVLKGAPKEEKYQYTQEEMGSDGQWHLTERKAGRRAIYKEEDGFVTLYECNAVNEDGTPMNPIATETTYTYYNDPLQVASHGKIKTLRRNDGYWENKYYDNNASAGLETEKTESPWLDTAAHEPGTSPAGDIRVKTEISCSTDTGTEDITETVNGILIAKEWTEKTPYDHQKVKEIRHQPHSGGDKITTTIRYRKAKDIPTHLTGKPVSIHNADGSMILYSYELQDQNLIIKADEGYGSENSITHGIRTVSTQDKDTGQLKEEVRYAIEGGQAYWLSSKTGVTFDGKGTCLKWVYNNDPDDYTEQRKDCCQVIWERARDGIEVKYTRDVDGRILRTEREGIVNLYEHKGLLTIEYQQLKEGGDIYLVAKKIKNLTGKIENMINISANKQESSVQFVHNVELRTISEIRDFDGAMISTIKTRDGFIIEKRSNYTISEKYNYTFDEYQGIMIIELRNLDESGGFLSGFYRNGFDMLNNVVFEIKVHDNIELSCTNYRYDSSGRNVYKKNEDNEIYITEYLSDGVITGIDCDKDGVLNLMKDRVSRKRRSFDISWPNAEGSWRDITEFAYNGNWITSDEEWKTENGIHIKNYIAGIKGYSEVIMASNAEKATGKYSELSIGSTGSSSLTTYTKMSDNKLDIVQEFKDISNNVMSWKKTTKNEWGQVVSEEEPKNGKTNYIYNGIGNLISSIEDPSGLFVKYKYDNLGRKIESILPDGSRQYWGYNMRNDVILEWGSQQYPVKYKYDIFGNKISFTTFRSIVNEVDNFPENQEGDTTFWQYDMNGNVIKKIYPDGACIIYSYSPGGKIKTMCDSKNIIKKYYYNNSGDMVKLVYDDGITPEIQNKYDQIGNLIESNTLGVSNYKYVYNEITSQLMYEDISINIENGRALKRRISRDYDEFMRIKELSIMNGEIKENLISYKYNDMGLVESVSSGNDIFEYSYHTLGKTLLKELKGPVYKMINSYEEHRNVITSRINEWNKSSDQSYISRFDYVNNSLGKKITRRATTSTLNSTRETQWKYDKIGQLIEEDIIGETNKSVYSYDSIGNRVRSVKNNFITNYSSSVANQYVQIGSNSQFYDATGNQERGFVSRLGGISRSNLSISYDAENRLNTLSKGGSLLKKYSYDHEGRLVMCGNVVTLYDGLLPIADYDYNSGNLQKIYTWGIDIGGRFQSAGGINGLLSISEFDTMVPSISYPVYDANGNITQYVARADDDFIIKASYFYDGFGNIIESNGDKKDYFEFLFSTKRYDKDSGLYNFGRRYYDPAIGRWITRDPIEEEGGSNLYRMSRNMPVSHFDSWGLTEEKYTDCMEGGFEMDSGGKATKFLKKLTGASKKIPKWGIYLEGDFGGGFSGKGKSCKECCSNGEKKDVQIGSASGSVYYTITGGYGFKTSFQSDALAWRKKKTSLWLGGEITGSANLAIPAGKKFVFSKCSEEQSESIEIDFSLDVSVRGGGSATIMGFTVSELVVGGGGTLAYGTLVWDCSSDGCSFAEDKSTAKLDFERVNAYAKIGFWGMSYTYYFLGGN